MSKMCYCCMTPSVEGGICRKCGEPELTAASNGAKALPPGTVLAGGRITVGKKLGSGGFGITYIAFDHKMNQRIALKEFLPNYMADREGVNIVPKTGSNEAYLKAMNSFRKEARALYELRGHPNIVHVITTFRENNTAYYSMELLDGESLLSFLKRRKRVSGEEAFKLLFPIMDAVRYMHKRNILHRDISPDNIMLCSDPENGRRIVPKLIDFGAAHVAIEGFSASYPGVKKKGFSPLEQNWDGKAQGPWTDIYSLCATFYGVVHGDVPVASVDRAAMMNSARGEDPLKSLTQENCNISKEMDDVIMKGLALNYQDRIQSMDELMVRLMEARNASTGETVIDLPAVNREDMPRPVGRRILAWILDSAMLAAPAAVFLLEAEKSTQERILPLMLLPILFMLNWVLVVAARGTLGQLLTGLRIRKDDMSGSSIGAGYGFVYMLLYPGLIGMILGMVYLASGKDIGPLEGICQGYISRSGENMGYTMGGVVISRSVSRPVSQSSGPRDYHSPTPKPPAPKPASEKGRQSQGGGRAGSSQEGSGQHSARRQSSERKVTPSPTPDPVPQPVPVPRPAETAHLVVHRADDALLNMVGKVITVHSGDTLGKKPDLSMIVLSDATVSKLHCRFLYQQGRGWMIKDEESRNGTFVNEQRIPAGGIAPLKTGNMIRVGKETLEFK